MKRVLLLLLAAVVLLPVLLVAGFYGYENWTGAAAWQRAEKMLRQAGEPLTVEELLRKPVPDADNMAAAPVFRQLFTFYNPRRASVYSLGLPPVRPAPAGADRSALIALARRFQPDFQGDPEAASRVVLDGLAPMEPLLDAIRLAAARPDAVWPVKLDRPLGMPSPFLPPLRKASEVLAARATASVAGRQPESALADFELITRLAGRSNQPPALAGCFAQQAMLGYAIEIVRDGLTQDSWSDEDLARIEIALGRLHPIESFCEGLRGERALFLASSDALNAHAETMFSFTDFRTQFSEWLTTTFCRVTWNLRPSGWTARDRANYVVFTQDWLERVIHNGVIRPRAIAELNVRLRATWRDPMAYIRTPLTVLMLPTFSNAGRAAAYTQVRLDLARLGCAIERFRRDNGHIPASLDELTPRWIDSIPRDVVGGGRFFYRVGAGESYSLYGKGWNAKDDGGSSANANPLLGPSTADDWVWNVAASGDRVSK